MEPTELQETWLQALESGRYQQTCHQLGESEIIRFQNIEGRGSCPVYGTPTAYCCLGVGCEITKEAGLIDDYHPHMGIPPRPVVNAIGWIQGGPDDLGIARLIHLNDVERKELPQIAAEVRAHPEKYFVAPAPEQPEG